ncbi:hypothetical protein [Streptomyces violaceusniger]|uniref:hypothetical protein n=1 Tax=Streptomyces violaceusniger TaxID=68280 RepID=UPI0036D0E4D4
MTSRDLGRLAAAVKKRRTELKLGVEAAAKAAGMSKDTWYKVEGSPTRPIQPVRDTTYARVDEVLQWAAGSCIAIAEGSEPVPIEHAEDGSSVVFADLSTERLSEEVQIAVNEAAIAVTDLPAEQIRKLNQRAIEALKRRGVI